MSVPGLHRHVQVIGTLQRLDSGASGRLLVRGTRHPKTRPGPTEGVIHDQTHRTRSRVRQLPRRCDGPTGEVAALPSRRGIHHVHSEWR